MKLPNELIVKAIDRSRDKFLIEFNKFEALYENLKFFTEEGVKERKEKIKLRVLINQSAYVAGGDKPTDTKALNLE